MMLWSSSLNVIERLDLKMMEIHFVQRLITDEERIVWFMVVKFDIETIL